MAHVLPYLTEVVLAPCEYFPFAADTSSVTLSKADGGPLANKLQQSRTLG